jgi:hypothetical protein
MTLRDDYGRETTKRIELVEQVLLADYQTLADAVTGALAPITDLGVVRCDLVIEDFSSLGSIIASGANVDVGATFTGELVGGGNKKASHKVPGITASFVGADGTIDITATEIAAYLALFEQSSDQALLSDGEQIEDWLRGKLDR